MLVQENIEIRKAQEDDYRGMVDVEASSKSLFESVFTPEVCKQMLVGGITVDDFLNGDERICHYVSVHNNRISGYVSYYLKDNQVLWITNIYVHTDFQGHRIGASLLAFIEELAAQEGLVAVALETQNKMTWAVDFYKKNNYKLLSWKELNIGSFKGTLSSPPDKSTCVFGKSLI